MAKVVRPCTKTRHHLVPRSRNNGKKGKGNIKGVEWRIHEAWHNVFLTMTPFEAVLCVIRFWSDNVLYKRISIKAEWHKERFTFNVNKGIRGVRALYNYDATLPARKDGWRILFEGLDPVSTISHIANNWSPEDYFKEIVITAEVNDEKITYLLEEAKQS